MTRTCTLGVDIASHGVRVVLWREGRASAVASAAYPPPPPPARRPAGQWRDGFLAALSSLPRESLRAVEAIGISGMRGALVGVDADGHPVTEAIPDFDADSIAAARLVEERVGQTCLLETGCPAFPLSSLPKIRHFMNAPGLSAFLGPQDFLALSLTGELSLSAGSALRMGVLDSAGGAYAHQVLERLGIDGDLLPPLSLIGAEIGRLVDADTIGCGLKPGLPLVAAPGDVPAALLAAGRGDPKAVFLSLGTTSVITAPVPAGTTPRLPFTMEVIASGHRSFETGTGAGGVTLDWLARILGLEDVAALERLAVTAPPSNVAMKPEMLDPWGEAPGAVLSGLKPETGPAEIARAGFVAVASSALSCLERLEAVTGRFDRLLLGGGGAASKLLQSVIATARPGAMDVFAGRELAAEGAAMVAAGVFPMTEPEGPTEP